MPGSGPVRRSIGGFERIVGLVKLTGVEVMSAGHTIRGRWRCWGWEQSWEAGSVVVWGRSRPGEGRANAGRLSPHSAKSVRTDRDPGLAEREGLGLDLG